MNAGAQRADHRGGFVEDVQAMRRRVIENVPARVASRELKLGPGGLRATVAAIGQFTGMIRAENPRPACVFCGYRRLPWPGGVALTHQSKGSPKDWALYKTEFG